MPRADPLTAQWHGASNTLTRQDRCTAEKACQDCWCRGLRVRTSGTVFHHGPVRIRSAASLAVDAFASIPKPARRDFTSEAVTALLIAELTRSTTV